MHMGLNCKTEGKHVPVIEHYIRNMKELAQAVYYTLPFISYPAWLVVEMVYATVFWLNAFPMEGGVSVTISPCTLLTGQVLSFGKHCQLEFGTYAQVHELHDSSMIAWTMGALALCPTGNAQGCHFLSA